MCDSEGIGHIGPDTRDTETTMNRRMNEKLLAEAERKLATARLNSEAAGVELERVSLLWEDENASNDEYAEARESRDYWLQKVRVAEDWFMTVQGRVDVFLEAVR